MLKKIFTLILVVFVSLSVPGNIRQTGVADSWKITPVSDFQTEKGDYLMADLENGVAYLANEKNKSLTVFPLLSGQKRFGGTPEQLWVAKEKNIQGNRVTFAESGEFFRLYSSGETGEKRTHYGIHGHKYFEEMLATGNRFKSLGCLLVADDVLDVIERSFVANFNELKVVTTKEIGLTSFLKVSFLLSA